MFKRTILTFLCITLITSQVAQAMHTNIKSNDEEYTITKETKDNEIENFDLNKLEEVISTHNYIVENFKDNIIKNDNGTIEILNFKKIKLKGNIKKSYLSYLDITNDMVLEGIVRFNNDFFVEIIPDEERISPFSLGNNYVTSGANGIKNFDLNTACWNNRQYLQKLMIAAGFAGILLGPTGTVLAPASVVYTFYNKVNYNGDWDFKVDLGYNTVYRVTVGGSVVYMQGQDIGNAHYGYVGRVLFPSSVLNVAAGVAQAKHDFPNIQTQNYKTFFDEPRDQKYIDIGVEWYNTGHLPVNKVNDEKGPSISNTTPYPGYYIQYGSQGSNVTKVQNRLNQLGFNCGTADGIFGAKTKTAVINFQRSRGLAADGIIGPATWNKLFN